MPELAMKCRFAQVFCDAAMGEKRRVWEDGFLQKAFCHSRFPEAAGYSLREIANPRSPKEEARLRREEARTCART
jgi:hypothetical protein